MKIWLNGYQVRKAIDHFHPEVWAEVSEGDVYIDTSDDSIVFMGVEYPVSYPLSDSGFELDCADEPSRLIAMVSTCDCYTYGRITIADQKGKTIGELRYDLWEETSRDVVTNYLNEIDAEYYSIAYVFL